MQEQPSLEERVEVLERRFETLSSLLQRVLAHLEGLSRDLGLVSDVRELQGLRQLAVEPVKPSPKVERVLAIEGRLERVEAATRSVSRSASDLRRVPRNKEE